MKKKKINLSLFLFLYLCLVHLHYPKHAVTALWLSNNGELNRQLHGSNMRRPSPSTPPFPSPIHQPARDPRTHTHPVENRLHGGTSPNTTHFITESLHSKLVTSLCFSRVQSQEPYLITKLDSAEKTWKELSVWASMTLTLHTLLTIFNFWSLIFQVKLADPDIVNNHTEYQKLAQSVSELESVLVQFSSYIALLFFLLLSSSLVIISGSSHFSLMLGCFFVPEI